MPTNNIHAGRAAGLALLGVLVAVVTMIGGVLVGRSTEDAAPLTEPARNVAQQLRIEVADCTPIGYAYSATDHRGLAMTETDDTSGYTLIVNRSAMVWPEPAIGHADGWTSVGSALDLNAQFACTRPGGGPAATTGLTVSALPWRAGVTVDVDCANGDAPPTAPAYSSTGHVSYHPVDGTASGHVSVTDIGPAAVLHATCPAR